ncbi:MAG: HDIG domain-containing metalloprotein [Thermoleophilia bacterium]
MKPPTRLGRTILFVRGSFNSINIRVFAIGMIVATWLVLWALLGSAYMPARYDLQTGDVATDFIRAPRTLTFENRDETERRREQVAEQVPGVYSYDAAVLQRVSRNINGYFENVARIVAEEKAASQAASQLYDPARSVRRIMDLPGTPVISEGSLTVIAGLEPVRITDVGRVAHESTGRILDSTVTEATLATDRDKLKAILQTTQLTPAEMAAVAEMAGTFLEPNNVYNGDKTQLARDQAAVSVQPVVVTVRSGETIVSPGQVITADNVATLEALGLTEDGRRLGTFAGLGLLLAVQVAFMTFYINRFEKRVRESRAMIFIVASLLVLFTLIDRISAISPLTPLIVPMTALGMLGTLMLGTRMAAILVVLASANLAVVGGSDPQYIIVGLLGGICAVFLVTSVSQRRDLLKAGLISGAVVTATAMGAGQISETSFTRLASSATWGMGNAALAIVATIGLLTVYEMVFNLPTPLKLLELADPTRPVLKELMMKTPGTYNHSIIMGNIAETAAEAIGANPLLARVGAYYHDIGKLSRPDYFIENQFHVKNPHDRLTPGLSRLAITAHVKDGVRLAQEEGLPPEILDIIREHHGTTVLSYFYHKAKVTARDGKVDEETYRYAGQKPGSRESAIIMLADSVEAAVRSIPNPTPRKIKTVIKDIFDHRLRDGQLSESRMTFGDLEKVRKVFEKCLQGFGATRIAYPGSLQAVEQSSKKQKQGTGEGSAGSAK